MQRIDEQYTRQPVFSGLRDTGAAAAAEQAHRVEGLDGQHGRLIVMFLIQ